jgi:RND family efflux transporter MFP subunit
MRLHPSFVSRPALAKGLSLPVLLTAVVLLGLIGWRLFSTVQAKAALREDTQAAAKPTVLVTAPAKGQATEELVLPGSVQAWSDAPIYARTSGYLKRRLVDIGDTVKAGQLLAEIDAPEVDQQLRQAEADLAVAEANNKVAQGTAERYKQLLATQSVAPQDAEDRIGDGLAKAATVNAARANVQRLRELQGFARVTAPFDGVVTARNTDVGALVVAASTSGQALFHVSSTRKLRVYVETPESLAAGITTGLKADLRFVSQPGKSFPAKVTSTSTVISASTRTLLTQLEVDNANGTLLPGAYAEVHFKLPLHVDTLRVPGNALLFRADGLSVVTVDAQDTLRIKSITQGRDFGKEVEVLSGLQPTDRIVLNPPDSALDGTAVRVTVAKPKPAPTAVSAGSAAK